MNLYLLSQYKLIQHLYNDSSYLDLLMNVDDFFDILNVYAYPNWFEAEVVEFKIFKHYINIILKTPIDKMPHPNAGILLDKYDCMVKYKKTSEYVPVDIKSESDLVIDKHTHRPRPKMKKVPCWLVDIMIPSKHIVNDNVYDLESIQQKLDDNNEKSDNTESVVNNNDEIAEPQDNLDQMAQQG